MKKVRTPTKICPHRWCKTLHRLMLLAGIVTYGIMIAAHGLAIFGAFLLGGSILTVFLTKILGPKATEFMAPDRKAVTVDQKWANRAVAVDLLGVLFFWERNVNAALHMHEPVGAFTGGRLLFTIVATVGASLLWGWPHYRATRPRRPKRVWVWLRSTAGAFGN